MSLIGLRRIKSVKLLLTWWGEFCLGVGLRPDARIGRVQIREFCSCEQKLWLLCPFLLGIEPERYGPLGYERDMACMCQN